MKLGIQVNECRIAHFTVTFQNLQRSNTPLTLTLALLLRNIHLKPLNTIKRFASHARPKHR